MSYQTRSFHGEIGSLCNKLLRLSFFYLGWRLYGTGILNEFAFVIFETAAYVMTGWFLRKIRFWRY